MAAAKDIVAGDKHALTWLEILDTDGVRWKYHQAGVAIGQETVHIYQHDNARLEIMRDGAGGLLLRQDGPGLPRSCGQKGTFIISHHPTSALHSNPSP